MLKTINIGLFLALNGKQTMNIKIRLCSQPLSVFELQEKLGIVGKTFYMCMGANRKVVYCFSLHIVMDYYLKHVRYHFCIFLNFCFELH